jgi:hypothetical protein
LRRAAISLAFYVVIMPGERSHASAITCMLLPYMYEKNLNYKTPCSHLSIRSSHMLVAERQLPVRLRKFFPVKDHHNYSLYLTFVQNEPPLALSSTQLTKPLRDLILTKQNSCQQPFSSNSPENISPL